jgi:hypothetical protein
MDTRRASPRAITTQLRVLSIDGFIDVNDGSGLVGAYRPWGGCRLR